MKVDIPLESCWRADEIRYIGLALKRFHDREYYRRKILERMDLELPDYPRPTVKIERQRKKVDLIKLVWALMP